MLSTKRQIENYERNKCSISLPVGTQHSWTSKMLKWFKCDQVSELKVQGRASILKTQHALYSCPNLTLRYGVFILTLLLLIMWLKVRFWFCFYLTPDKPTMLKQAALNLDFVTLCRCKIPFKLLITKCIGPKDLFLCHRCKESVKNLPWSHCHSFEGCSQQM